MDIKLQRRLERMFSRLDAGSGGIEVDVVAEFKKLSDERDRWKTAFIVAHDTLEMAFIMNNWEGIHKAIGQMSTIRIELFTEETVSQATPEPLTLNPPKVD